MDFCSFEVFFLRICHSMNLFEAGHLIKDVEVAGLSVRAELMNSTSSK